MDLVGKSYMLIGYGSCHGSIRHYQKELLVLYVAVYRRRFLRTERLALGVCALTFLRILMKGQVIRRSVSINHKRSGQTINRHLFSWRRVSSRLSLFRVVDMVLLCGV